MTVVCGVKQVATPDNRDSSHLTTSDLWTENFNH